MLNKESLFRCVVEARFYIFEGQKFGQGAASKRRWKLYESIPEEGSQVKKKLADFEERSQALAALEDAKQQFLAMLDAKFEIVEREGVQMSPVVIDTKKIDEEHKRKKAAKLKDLGLADPEPEETPYRGPEAY